MVRYALARLLHAIPTLLLTSCGIFVLLRVLPGDPSIALAGTDASPETIATIRADLGLDDPLPLQYARWLAHLASGDLGHSVLARRTVAELIGLALPATLELTFAALALAMVIGGTLGVIAAMSRARWPDMAISALTAALIGVPSFWLGLLAILLFSLVLGWLPPGGRVDPLQDPAEAVRSLILPAGVLGLGRAAVLARFTRVATLEVLSEAFVLTARGKGMHTRALAVNHVIPNALIPVVTICGLEVGHLLGGALIIESVFAWPGMGRLVVGAILGRDYDVVQAVLLLLVGGFILVNLTTDVLYGVLDPRVRVAD